MKTQMFNEPVTVLVGLGYPLAIRSVIEAYRFLQEWPGAKGDPVSRLAMNACKAALEGAAGPETARGLLVAFAEKHGVLAPDISNVIAQVRRTGLSPSR